MLKIIKLITLRISPLLSPTYPFYYLYSFHIHPLLPSPSTLSTYNFFPPFTSSVSFLRPQLFILLPASTHLQLETPSSKTMRCLPLASDKTAAVSPDCEGAISVSVWSCLSNIWVHLDTGNLWTLQLTTSLSWWEQQTSSPQHRSIQSRGVLGGRYIHFEH